MSHRTLSPADPTYPRRLRGFRDAPWLRVRGQIPDARGVAIVGTRKPTPHAIDLAQDLARAAAREGLIVWSGGAYGIDTAAHRGAIEGGGPTVVVFGGGLNHPSPKHNADLFEEIVDSGGAWVSQFADRVEPVPFRFLMRNAVLASSVELLVVVECPVKSGARNAVLHARKASTPVAAVPHSPWDPTGAGCNLEIRAGAHPITSPADLLALVARLPPRPAELLAPTEPISTFALRLLAGLDHPRHADELAIELAAPAAEVLAALVELRMHGHVVSCADGRVERGPRSHDEPTLIP